MSKIDLALYSQIAAPATRRSGARALAQMLGAEDLIVFDFDIEIGRYLPSSGFPQTLPGGKAWKAFLSSVCLHSFATGTLSVPGYDASVEVIGKMLYPDCLWVFIQPTSSLVANDEGLMLLAQNLLTVLKSERQAIKYEGQNATLSELTDDLRTYADSLNITKSQLNHALKEAEAAKIAAEKANTTKSAFLANMSHEIRTPLSAILGFSSLLKEQGFSQEEKVQFIETILRNGQALTRIIDDILDLAKVEAGKLEIEKTEFSFLNLIDDVMDVFRERTRAKNIYLRTNVAQNVPTNIISDPTRLRQIFLNIIGNAVKFTELGGITLQVTSEVLSNSEVSFEVAVHDTGLGMSEEQQSRVFQPFMQADNSTTRKYGGTGLGLALSKRLAVALGGDITIQKSVPGQGCTFLICFKAGLPEVSSGDGQNLIMQSAMQSSDLALYGTRILVAEDSVDNQNLIRVILTRLGCEVEFANNGREAFRMAISGTYSLVLMDIQMPVMDGYEATQALRNAGFKTPIVALTAHAMVEERARSKAAGCDYHLTKPLNQIELIETVQRFILK